MNQITKDSVFPQARPSPANKAEATDRAARAIIEEEAKRREAKTRRLRQARLEMEAQQPKSAPAKPRAKKAPARTGRRAG